MKEIGYYNGKTGPLGEMTVPMNDRVCWFGDGVYDVALAPGRVPYLFDRHIDRFFTSAALIRIDMPLDRDELKKLIFELIGMADDDDLLVYMQVTRGTAPRAHAFPMGAKANLWLTVTPKKVAPKEGFASVITTDDNRYYLCNIKTLNLIPNCMAEQFAKDAGCDTAIFHRGDRVTEAAHSNVQIITGGKVITPPADNLILPGISRGRTIEICREIGIPVEIRPFTLDEMLSADEIFLTSSLSPCRRVGKVNLADRGMKDPDTFFRLQDAVYADFAGANKD